MNFWTTVFGARTSEWLIVILSSLWTFCFILIPLFFAYTFLERKLAADIQARVGPNQSGPFGVFQFVIDAMKLLQKREASWSEHSSSWGIHKAGNILLIAVLFSTVPILPLGEGFALVDTDFTVFLPLIFVLIFSITSLVVGLASQTVESSLGALRLVYQVCSAFFPGLISVLTVAMISGGFRWGDFVIAQTASPLGWNLFSAPPFLFISFVVFVSSGCLLHQISPANAATASLELGGGAFSTAHGRNFAALGMTKFYAFFLWALVGSVLFLGGWNLPEGISESLRRSDSVVLLNFLQLVCVVIKTFGLMWVLTLISRSIPTVRVDHSTDVVWKVLSPLSLLALLGAALMEAWGF